MRDVPRATRVALEEGVFIGRHRPMARITVQHPGMKLRKYSLMTKFTQTGITNETTGIVDTYVTDYKHGHKVNQTYADFLFTHLFKPMELPNVQQLTWERSTDSDVADCTITLLNTKQRPFNQPQSPGQFDYPGWYTYSRGATALSAKIFHQSKNAWQGMLVPDNIIRTYEGYGADLTVAPEIDPYLVQTGTWIIDTVQMSATGTMTIKCRDLGRILLEQMYWYPVVPKDWYATGYENWDDDKTTKTTKHGRLHVIPDDSSNTPWVGKGNAVAGHTLNMAFDNSPNTFWVSIGNDRPSRRYAYEWIQCNVKNQTVGEIRFATKKKGYIAYVSVMIDGKWQGAQKINYHEDGIGRNHADIKYVTSGPVDSEDENVLTFPKPYKNVQKIRLTLGNLQNFNFGTYRYRAGVRYMDVYAKSKESTTDVDVHGPAGANPGRYSDYTDLVKLFLAWGGWFWPTDGRQRICNPPDVNPKSPIPGYNQYRDVAPRSPDERVLGKGVKGRIWGDLQQSGTTGTSALDPSNFDKKSLMDCIKYVQDILGFAFWIDETGAAIWRLPNIYNKGCMWSAFSHKTGYNAEYVHYISEVRHMTQFDATIDESNVRESYFVGNDAGKIGAFAPGWNPNPTGLRRMAGWTDQNFETQEECQVMADMLSLRQLFTYRTDSVVIPANPAIQLDDQARLMERTSSDGYVHYVKGISSSNDLTSGQWTYTLSTFWLGLDPKTRWIWYPSQVYHATGAQIKKQVKLSQEVPPRAALIAQDETNADTTA
jgi:hypothetical protein